MAQFPSEPQFELKAPVHLEGKVTVAASSDVKTDLRMKIVHAIHEATDQYGTAAGVAAGKILAIPEIRDALNEHERKDRPKVRLLPIMPSQRGGLARAAQKEVDDA